MTYLAFHEVCVQVHKPEVEQQTQIFWPSTDRFKWLGWAISSTIPGSRADTEGADSSSLSAKSPNCHWDNKRVTSIAFVAVSTLTFNILHWSFNFETVSPNNSLSSCALSAELPSQSFAKTWSNTVLFTDTSAIAVTDYGLHFTVGFCLLWRHVMWVLIRCDVVMQVVYVLGTMLG